MSGIFTVAVRRTFISTLAACALTAALPQAGLAQGMRVISDSGLWKINIAQSKFNRLSNTLVIERAKPNAQGTGSPSGTRFLVIASGKVYLATADDVASGESGVRNIDYSSWRNMKLVQIGYDVRSADYCNFRCQSGLTDNRLTVTFKTKGLEGQRQIDAMVASNK